MPFVPRSMYVGPRVPLGPTALWLLVVSALGLSACSKHRTQLFNENLLPTVVLGEVAVDTTRTEPDTWRATIAYGASDADGAVRRVEYAMDPGVDDTVWVVAPASPIRLTFPVRARNAQGYLEPDYRVVLLRARDDRSEASPVVWVPLYAVNQPPQVSLTQPVPSAFVEATVPASFIATWEGFDPDGYPTRVPPRHRVRLLREGEPLYSDALVDPDVLLRDAATTEWAGWQEVFAPEQGARFDNVANGEHALLAVVAVDANGVVTPHLQLGVNMTRVTGSSIGPTIRISIGSLQIVSIPPGGSSAASYSAEVPAQRTLAISWDATPPAGSRIARARWRLDPTDPADSTERQTPGDLQHWGTVATLPSLIELPGLPIGDHRLYIEVTDTQARRSLVVLTLSAVAREGELELLIVDDTRREPDRLAPGGCTSLYTTIWPSAAELDTFLYARGGVPWRCVHNGANVNSNPGLFAGFPFDTTGTRRGFEDPARSVTLAQLLRYRHVIWIVDLRAAQFSPGNDPSIFPETALRAMSEPGHQNVLSAYVAAGGHLWLAGGGAAAASLLPYDVNANNSGPTTFFTAQAGELTPERMMWSAAHVRSGIGAVITGARIEASPAALGGWSGHGLDGTLSAPDYSRLPALLRPRDPGTDPLPPTRASTQTGTYYPFTFDLEYVSEPNPIVEDMDPASDVVRMESALDTLMQATGTVLSRPQAPIMTYYHGREGGTVVFSGFSLWSWTRPDAQALVDFVLSDIWKLSRAGNPGVSGPALQARPGPARVIGTRRTAQ